MSKTFQAPAILHVGAPTQDGGMRARIETNELTDDEKMILLSYHGKFGYFLFKENEFSLDDLPKGDAIENRTPSQELRYWIERYANENGMDKRKYYLEQMDKYIEHGRNKVKNKLN